MMESIELPSTSKQPQNVPKKHTKFSPSQLNCFNFLQDARDYFYDFCDKTSMHGFRFLVEIKRTLTEKIWWSLIIIVAVYFCITQTTDTYKKWMESPVIVSFATEQTPIWQIPFPAVTICPQTKMKRDVFNYTDVFLKKNHNRSTTPEESKFYDYASLICDNNSEGLNETRPTLDKEAIDSLVKMAPNMDETFFKVKWRGADYEPQELFTPILTSEGICYSFNILDRTAIFTDVVTQYEDFQSIVDKEPAWVIEKGYAKGSTIDSYPRRTLVSGSNGGLTITFSTLRKNLDYACDPMQGYKVILHNAAEIPQVEQKYFLVPLDQTVIAAIKPNMMTTSGDLDSYKPQERLCYLTTERKLTYFKIYNQQNCMIECLNNYTLSACGCVGFYMARENSTNMCGAANSSCIDLAKAEFIETTMIELAKTVKDNPDEESSICNCRPSCSSLDYDVETSTSEWAWKNYIQVAEKRMFADEAQRERVLKNAHFSKLILLFKDNQFMTSERNELYGTVDFWANCGGLLGLFTGFSFISLFEILYYFTLRLGCNIRMFGRKNWAGIHEDEDEEESRKNN